MFSQGTEVYLPAISLYKPDKKEKDWKKKVKTMKKETDKKIPCPICGNMAFEEEGDFDICEVCGWENDDTALDYPDESSGPNEKWSVNAARKAWASGETLFEHWPNPNAKK